MWLLLTFLNSAIHAWSNVLDNYLTDKLFKRVTTLAFYSTLFSLIFLPIVWAIQTPSVPPIALWPVLLVIALTNVLYLFPYYEALRSDDTSVVASLFSLGKIFIPVLAFFIVGEALTVPQYLGFLLIIGSSVFLTLKNTGAHVKLSRSLFLMILSSFVVSLQAVAYKYLLNDLSWSTVFVWSSLPMLVFIALFLFFRGSRTDIVASWNNLRGKFNILFLEEFLTFAGYVAGMIALSMAPVTLVKGVESVQGLFVLFYGICFSRFLPRMFHERTDTKSIVKKSFLFLLIALGIFLIAD
jgi:drug/metabolite transporter (DMT)-like permease